MGTPGSVWWASLLMPFVEWSTSCTLTHSTLIRSRPRAWLQPSGEPRRGSLVLLGDDQIAAFLAARGYERVIKPVWSKLVGKHVPATAHGCTHAE